LTIGAIRSTVRDGEGSTQMADLDSFRRDTRAWLEANAPASMRTPLGEHEEPSWGGRTPTFANADAQRWLEVMAARGWTAPTWPSAYGGGGLSKEEGRVLAQEMAALRLRPPLVGFGLTMIGPTLLQIGSEELKRAHLPAIVRGEIRWCQGYSEPGSGSDLASLQTRAVVDGDDFVVSGQKVWTSYADQADWMFLLVRTDPAASKHQGITFLLMDMRSPGVSVKPIKLISGYSPFCETFLDNVRVPRTQVLGELNQGWTVAKALLGHERTMIADIGKGFGGETKARTAVQLARDYLGERDGAIADPSIRHRLAQAEIDQRCLDWTLARSRDTAKAGHAPGPETSIFKYYGTELNKRRRELMISILGPQALGWEGDGFDAEELEITRDWLRSRGNSIEGGTSEIQLNIIAKRVLGLPD
jgi:alkylation response protein AidB-like acyl-CoA dehydrogenase